MTSTRNSIVSTPADRDRLLFSLFVVCLLHALLIFGIKFVQEDLAIAPTPPAIEIIINQAGNEIIPEEADYLGRSNSAGGDPDVPEKIRRSDLFASVSPQQDLGVAPVVQEQLNAPSPVERAPDLLTVWASEERLHSQSEAEPEKEPVNVNSAVDRDALQLASLTQELRVMREKLSRQSRKLTLNSNTREYIAAAYVREWVQLVESVGNTNLPAAARKLTGEVVLEVDIDSHGKLIGSRVLRSSGHASLDEAALMSVKLASPFKPFTRKLREKVDILNIVRTWQYNNRRLETAPYLRR